MDKKFLKNIFDQTGLVHSFIKVGIHNRNTDHYQNRFFEIKEDLELTITEVEKCISLNVGSDIYIAPVTYASGAGTKDQVNFVMALIADYDEYDSNALKDMDSKEAEAYRQKMAEELKMQNLKPSQIISSGNGLQVYWRLIKPLRVTDQTKKIEGGQKVLATQSKYFKGDMAAAVLGHTLRLPGTKNFKNPDEIKDCHIIWTDETVTYDFEALVSELNVPERNDQMQGKTTYSGTLVEAIQELNTDYEHVRSAALKCDFFREMAKNPRGQTYSLWFHICNNLVNFGDHGRELFHTISEKYSNYSHEETENLFQTTQQKVQSNGMLPTSCCRIAEDGFTCPNTCLQKTPAGMLFSQMKRVVSEEATIHHSVTVEELIKNIIPSQSTIENIKTLEDFIKNVINPAAESMMVKETYLKRAMETLMIPPRGNFNQFKKQLSDTSNGKSGNLQVDIAEEIRKGIDLRYIGGAFYAYDHGVWKQYTESIERESIEKLESNYSINNVSGISAYLKGIDFLSVKNINQHKKQNMICLQNGMLKLHHDGRRELLPHDLEYYALNQVAHDSDEKADCPRFMQYLEESFCAMTENDRRVTIQAVQEWFGYSLLPGNQMHRFAMLIGASRSGKGVLQAVYSELLGQDNISNIPLSELHKPINAIQLLDKMANVAPELGQNERFNEAFVKSAVGEDGISGRSHYEKTVSFVNDAKFMAASNHLPRIFEKSDALELRLLGFPFATQVPEEKRNIHLKDELKAELSGILNWAIEGRMRLFKRGRFIESQPMLDLKRKIREDNDLVTQWLTETKADLNPKKKHETLKDLFGSFRNFCAEEGVQKPPLRKTFKKDLGRIEGVSTGTPGKQNQVCVFFDWNVLGHPQLEDEKMVVEGNEKAGELTVLAKLEKEDIQNQTETAAQAHIVKLVNESLEIKNTDKRAFN